MELFVDREVEMQNIDIAIETLHDKKRLLRHPIVSYYGVGGIGKTLLLKNIQQRCQKEHLHSIWVDVNQNIADCVRDIVQQVRRSGVRLPFEENEDTLLYQSASALRILLERGPAVVLFDAVDSNDEDQLRWLETLLGELVDCNNLFIVLASKRALAFEHNRLLARNLTSIPLQTFNRPSCEAYLNSIGDQSEPEIRHLLFTWTRGYPLALSAMAQVVSRGLDPRKEEDQKVIIAMIVDQVLRQNVLVNVDTAVYSWYQAILSLLSVPRHFNIEIMQDLIEVFLPEQKRENSLAYFGLPKEINQIAEALRWSRTGEGFSVEVPIRAIFLLELKIEQPEKYYAVHRFLAQIYEQWATDESGAVRVRYLADYLYHKVSAVEREEELEHVLISTVKEIVQAFPQSTLQLVNEITQDVDFKDLLGQHFSDIKSLIEERRI